MPNVELFRHLGRVGLSLAALSWAVHTAPILVVPATAALVMAAFTLQHDLIHGSLGVGRKLREPLLAAVGSLMLMSGHATRIMHLIHHRSLYGRDDLEGATALVSWRRALAMTLGLFLRYRFAAFARAGARDRRWIVAESSVNLLVLTALLLSGVPALVLIAATGAALQVSLPIWAGRIPHRAPERLLAVARKLVFLRSPVLLSLVFHELHHQHPKVPCARLVSPRAPG